MVAVDVPSPVPPDDRDAWYAPAVHAQYAVGHRVIVSIHEGPDAFTYEVREPSCPDDEALERAESYFEEASVQPPLTREGAAERLEHGLPAKWDDALDRLVDCSPAARRRLVYHVLSRTRCLGDVTPLALDSRVEMADAEGDRLVVHTTDFAPAVTDFAADTVGVERFASERLARYTVDFHGFEVPVVLYRENTLGGDPFAVVR
ncbi:hypothetical protein [Halorarius litoreus]|uniref:hypothetical protein n=1 Tax=Halorarius litoreus TaxID=2962676 RepID=UPI0020CD6EB7|nr:hypothetical protein [Halorarius litoreus]